MKSRERLLFHRVCGNTCAKKEMERGTELLRAMRKSNVEYEGHARATAEQETSFFVSECV